MAFTTISVGRLVLGAPVTSVIEPVGDQISASGAVAIPAARTPYQFQIQLATYLNGADTLAYAQYLRRALRSLLNNTPLKNQSFIYIIYQDDTEINGWYTPDTTTLAGIDATSWKAVGLWQTGAINWSLAGHIRNAREARTVWMKVLNTGVFERDQLGYVVSSDFSALTPLALTVLPNGATAVLNNVNGQGIAGVTLPTGRDGGTCLVVAGQVDLTTLSYERPETAMNLSDVIVYDRRGQITAPSGGPDTSWEEAYGPSFQWNWVTAGQANDSPVLDNGLVRIRYDASAGDPGLRVDLWTGSAYVEQGKVVFYRYGDSAAFLNTWNAASLVEWTPERGILKLVLSNSADAYSNEYIYVTVQRGELSAIFEYYPSLKSNAAVADAGLMWTPALNAGVADLNNGIMKNDSATAAVFGTAWYEATAGTGAGTGNSGQFSSSLTTLGNANFTTSENWASIIRCPTVYNTIGSYQTTLTVLQAAGAFIQYKGTTGGMATAAYGTAADVYLVSSQNGAGYLQVQVGFGATVSDQVNEAEGIRQASGTTSQTVDATASGGAAVEDTQTAETNATLRKATTNLLNAKYRVFARVKVTSGNTGSFRAQIGSVSGSVATTTSTAWIWIDLGEIAAQPATSALEIDAWRSAGSASGVFVDRVELVMTEDKARTGAIFSGARDQGQAALYDSRQLGTVVTR